MERNIIEIYWPDSKELEIMTLIKDKDNRLWREVEWDPLEEGKEFKFINVNLNKEEN